MLKLILKYTIVIVLISSHSCAKKQSKTSAPLPAPILISGGFIYNQITTNSVPQTTNATQIQCVCYFFNPPIDYMNSYGVSYVDVGAVTINAVTLQKSFYQPGVPNYFSNSITTLPLNVSISGSSNFLATTFTDNGNFFPSFTNSNQLPNSISKSAGLTFSLSNLVNTILTDVTIGNITNSFMGNVISFSPSQLSALSTSTFSTIKIKCQSTTNTLAFGNKNYSTTNTLSYAKQGISIVP